MNYNLLIERYKETPGTEYIPYTSQSDGWIDRLYDRNGSYVCQRDNYAGTTTCTAEGEFAPIIVSFGMTYKIEWDKANSGISVPVLDNWPHSVRPLRVGTFIDNHLFDNAQSRTVNQTPDGSWYLYFAAGDDPKTRLKISEWLAKSVEEQETFLGLTGNDPEPEKKPGAVGEKTTDATTQTGIFAGLKKLFSSSDPAAAKKSRLWIILAGILSAVVGVSIWAYRRYRRGRRKAEKVALKYGKYTQDVVDTVT